MTTIKLFGELGAKYGKEHSFQLDKLSEFSAAFEANYSGFKKFFLDSNKEGKLYTMFVDGVLIKDEAHLQSILESVPKELVIVPFITGAAYSIGTWVAVTVIGLAEGSVAAGIVASLVSLVIYAVVSAVVTALFAPKPKGNIQSSTANAGLNSYYFAGRENRAQQGVPVPIVYGLLKVGSYVIQAGIRNLDKDDFAKLSDGVVSSIPTP